MLTLYNTFLAISDDESSDVGEIDISITTKRATAIATTTSTSAVSLDNNGDDDDNEMLDVLGDDAKGGDDEEADDDEDLEEDECAGPCLLCRTPSLAPTTNSLLLGILLRRSLVMCSKPM
jgi:hypothetical protein